MATIRLRNATIANSSGFSISNLDFDDLVNKEIAEQLRWRLARLQSMRDAAARLFARDLLNRDVFVRGQPEPVAVIRTRKHTDTVYDLLSAYSQQRIRNLASTRYEVPRAPVLLIEEARAHIERLLGAIPDWRSLTRFLPPEWTAGHRRARRAYHDAAINSVW